MTKNSNNESGCYIFLLIIGILFIFLIKMAPFLLLITIIVPLILYHYTSKNATITIYKNKSFFKSIFLTILDATIIPFLAFVILFTITVIVAIMSYFQN